MVDGHPGSDETREDGLAVETALPVVDSVEPAMPAKTHNRLMLTTASAAVLSLVMIGSLAYSGKTLPALMEAGKQAATAIPAAEPEQQATVAPPAAEPEQQAALAAPETGADEAAKSAASPEADSPERWQSAHIEAKPEAETSTEVAELDAAPAPETEAAAPSPILRNVPIPMPRPPEFRRAMAPTPTRRAERQRRDLMAAAPAPVEDTRSFFDKLLGVPASPQPALAYASLETNPTLPSIAKPLAPMPAPMAISTPRSGSSTAMLETKPTLAPTPKPLAPMPTPVPTQRAGGGTAVYDISAKTVTLPSGERLEAHSGIGETMDDPRYVHVSMRGATPPGTYDLTEREAPFHGVRALRMNPVGGSGAVHGRVGLLTHSYLRGPSGASSGCVSFRDYNRFLQAYLRGEVSRVVVVPGRGGPSENPISSFVNKLFGGA